MISSLQACRGRSMHLAGDALMHVRVRRFHITNTARLKEPEVRCASQREDQKPPTKKIVREFYWKQWSPKHINWSVANAKLEKTLRRAEEMHQHIKDTLTYLAEKPAASNSYRLDNLKMIDKEATIVEKHTIWLMASRHLYMELCVVESLRYVTRSNPHIILGVIPSTRKELGWAGARKLYAKNIYEVRRHLCRSISPPQHESATKDPGLIPSPKSLDKPRLARFHKALNRALVLVLAADRLFIVGEVKDTFRKLIGLARLMMATAERLELINDRIWLASQLKHSREYISEIETEISRVAERL
ncbi:hypothetical protein GGR58DRAFT_480826 [Xylaria digitata]|nr:hypothetical protein GGR58DRAFT_480826 [Xylaria digitata]